MKTRIKTGEIIVMLTDKSGKLAVITLEDYLKMGEVHTANDTEVTEMKARELERRINGHTSMWIKMSNMGENHRHTERIRETCINHSCAISSLYLLLKDHKIVVPGDLPATRPVCSGCTGFDVHFSNILSEFLEAIANAMRNSIEVISSEDLISKINEYNEELAEEVKKEIEKSEDASRTCSHPEPTSTKFEQEAVIIGADAKCLYPSLLGKHTGRIVREAAIKTDLKTEGINYKEMARYVAMEAEEFDVNALKLGRIIPKRRYRKGCKPGVTGVEPMGKESDDEIKWVFPSREPTEVEKKNLLALALEIGVKAAFSNHLYQFGGKIFHQTDGGPIGMRLAGAAARIVMGTWGERMVEILKKEEMKIWLSGCYVDDVRLVTSAIERGKRWSRTERKFIHKEEWEVEDTIADESDTARTARIMKGAMNSIFNNIQFETEIPEEFPEGKLPTLDFKMWVENQGRQQPPQPGRELPRGKIMFSYYEKKMSSKYCVMKSSAMAENSKNSTLSQDLIRRMLNTSELVPQSERNTIIENYIKKLKISGYSQEQTRSIIISGLKGYQTKLERSRKSGIKLHRSAKTTVNSRYKKKLTEKTNWFRKKRKDSEEGAEKVSTEKRKPSSEGKRWCTQAAQANQAKTMQTVTVLFVPRTPGGELASRLRKAEEELSVITGDKIKIVEKTGVMMKRILHRSNPWAGDLCGRVDCLVCMHGGEGGGDCRRRNITYRTSCRACHSQGKDRSYYGESSRTAFERGKEHLSGFQSENIDNHMFKHYSDEHQGEEISFSMKVIKGHMSAFTRQIHEAVIIQRNEKNGILNSKGEYNRCQLPRLGVIMGEKEARAGAHKQPGQKDNEKRKSYEMTDNEIEELFAEGKKEMRKRRKAVESENDAQPKAKKKKTGIRRPEIRPADKRNRSMEKEDNENGEKEEENDEKQRKKARLEIEENSKVSKNVKNESHSQRSKVQTIILFKKIPKNLNENVPVLPKNEVTEKNEKKQQKISHFFKKNQPPPTKSKPNNKANQPYSPVNHHPTHQQPMESRNKQRRSKPAAPAFKFKKISDHFQPKTNLGLENCRQLHPPSPHKPELSKNLN